MNLLDRALFMLIAATTPAESPEAVSARVKKLEEQNANGFRVLREHARRARLGRQGIDKKASRRKLQDPDYQP